MCLELGILSQSREIHHPRSATMDSKRKVDHDYVKAWVRDYQRITPTCRKDVDTDAAYDAHLALCKAEAEADLFAAPVTEPAVATYSEGCLFRRQAGAK
jgi:hypothetical protein